MHKGILVLVLALFVGCGKSPTEPTDGLSEVTVSPNAANFWPGDSVVFFAYGGDGSTYDFVIPGNDTLPAFQLEKITYNIVKVTRTHKSVGGKMILQITSPATPVTHGDGQHKFANATLVLSN